MKKSTIYSFSCCAFIAAGSLTIFAHQSEANAQYYAGQNGWFGSSPGGKRLLSGQLRFPEVADTDSYFMRHDIRKLTRTYENSPRRGLRDLYASFPSGGYAIHPDFSAGLESTIGSIIRRRFSIQPISHQPQRTLLSQLCRWMHSDIRPHHIWSMQLH